MKLSQYIFCVIVIVVGAFCFMNILETLSIKSGEYEYAVNIIIKKNYNEVSRYDYCSLSFDTEDNVNYENKSSFVPTKFNGKENKYILLFNNYLVINLEISSVSISGDFIKNYYDINGELITTSNLKILVEFLETEVRVIMLITNTNDIVYFKIINLKICV